MNYRLYPARDIQLGDRIVGLGPVHRIERQLGEIRLFWAAAPTTFITIGPDTQILADRPINPAPTSDQHSQTRGAA